MSALLEIPNLAVSFTVDERISIVRIDVPPGATVADAMASPFVGAFNKGCKLHLECDCCGWSGDYDSPEACPTTSLPCPEVEGRYHWEVIQDRARL